MKKINLSVLLTSFNRPNETIKTLLQLQKASLSGVFEVILLDDYHVHDKTFQQRCEAIPNVRYIHTGSQKQGQHLWRVPGFALNIGAKHSKGDVIILGNSEIQLQNLDVIQKIVDEVEKGNLCSPPVADSRGMRNPKLPFFLGVSRDDFFSVGGYDEDFTGYCFDDDDISTRLGSKAPFVLLEEKWWVYHHHDEKSKSDSLKDQDPVWCKNAWNYNRHLFEIRKGTVERNIGKEWGCLDKKYER